MRRNVSHHIDYTRLRRRVRQGGVGRDLRMIGIRDVDDLLSYFVFDEAAFGAFASAAEPVTDDRSVVDFRSPHYLSSGFGLGPCLREAEVNNLAPLGAAWKRYLFYFRQRRSVVPYLTNLGRRTPERVAARIERRAKPKLKVPAPIARQEWQRY
jgi:hypothetical protein